MLQVKSRDAYDVIFMDCSMPNCDGFQATHLLRSYPPTVKTPVVAMTAYTMPEDQQKCLREGMSDYISKPFTRQQFMNMADKWIGLTARGL